MNWEKDQLVKEFDKQCYFPTWYAHSLCVLQVDMGQSDLPRVRVAGRKEEERIVSLKVRGGGGRGCNTMCSGNDGGSGWMGEDDDQQVAPLKNLIPLFLLLRARTSWFPRSVDVVVVTIP